MKFFVETLICVYKIIEIHALQFGGILICFALNREHKFHYTCCINLGCKGIMEFSTGDSLPIYFVLKILVPCTFSELCTWETLNADNSTNGLSSYLIIVCWNDQHYHFSRFSYLMKDCLTECTLVPYIPLIGY